MNCLITAFISAFLLPVGSASHAAGVGGPPTAQPAPWLRYSPLDLAAIRSITPLGNLNPRGGHVFPTDHIYLDYQRRSGLPVYAPASGVILAIRDQSGGDLKVEVKTDARRSYYVAHLLVDVGIAVGGKIDAGQVIGRTSGSGSLDLGCVDEAVTLKGFVNPKRFPSSTLHAVSPLKCYSEPVRSRLYEKVNGAASKDGRIDFDIPGRLVGNWFLDGLSVRESARGEPAVWAKQLAFVYDVRQPNAIRISIGGTLAPAGIYEPLVGSPDPADVSPASGQIAYRVARPVGSQSLPALLLVQMVEADRIKVEFFSTAPADRAEFTSEALIYVR